MKKKCLLYVAPVILDYDNPNGVGKKIKSHCKVFAKYFQTYLISYGEKCIQTFDLGENSVKKNISSHKTRRNDLNCAVRNIIKEKDISCIYIRYHLSDPAFILLLQSIKRTTNAQIVIEIPTYPYIGEFSATPRDIIRRGSDSICSSFLRYYVDKIVTYSDDDYIFGIPTIKTINGVDVSKIRPVVHTEKQEINLISVSVTSSVHGYDRIIEGLRIYYASNPKMRVVYHIVGNGDEIENYRKMVEEYNLDSEVIIYGFKSGKELDAIYENADIAVNSLGIHRRKLKTESTLKTKEYAAKGLPMISSYPIDVFDVDDGDRYQLIVPSDDSPVDIFSVVEFYNSLYLDTKDVEKKIRYIAEKRCDMEITQKPVIEFFSHQKEGVENEY